MSQFVALTSEKHAESGWRPYDDHRHASSAGVVPLAMPEIAKAIGEFPLALARVSAEQFRLVALQGLSADRNLFVKDGHFYGRYVPAQFRAWPFALMKIASDAGEQRFAIGVDQASDLFREVADPANGDNRFFNDDGEGSEPLMKVKEFLEALNRSMAITQRAVDSLAQHELLIPWTLPPVSDGDEPLKGYYRVDESKLNALEASALKELRESNALVVAYGQLFSAHRVLLLKGLANNYANLDAARQRDSIDHLFGEHDDGIIKFNF